MLAELLNTPAGHEEQMRWSFNNNDEHLKIANAIFNKYGVNLPPYILDPMPALNSPDIATWAEQHQSAHSAFDAILNIAGNDLTDVDFTKQDQVESWLRIHFDEHNQAQMLLGYQD